MFWFLQSNHSCVCVSLFRKHIVFGKLVQGHEVLKKIENAGDEDGNPTVLVKVINCGEHNEGNDYGRTSLEYLT